MQIPFVPILEQTGLPLGAVEKLHIAIHEILVMNEFEELIEIVIKYIRFQILVDRIKKNRK